MLVIIQSIVNISITAFFFCVNVNTCSLSYQFIIVITLNYPFASTNKVRGLYT